MNLLPLNRYSKYELNNVKWEGETPAHWRPTRNKDIFSERGTLSLAGNETLLTVSHITGVTRRSEKTVNMFMAETMEGYKHCKQGDLVINTMWAWMGALGAAKEDGICSPAYGVYAPRRFTEYNPRYFDYLYRTPYAISEMTRNSKGIVSSRLRLYPKDFFQIQTALPPHYEQVQISNYLDLKTGQIDRKINLLGKKAERYLECKIALITDTVIRGLNKTAPMRESALELVGEIPDHWETCRLKEVGYLYSGLNGKNGSDFSIEDEPTEPFIPFTNIANNFYLSSSDLKSVLIYPDEKQNSVKKYDLFFLMSSEDYADVGKSSLLTVDMEKKTYLNSFCKGFRFTKRTINPRYVNYLLHSMPYRVGLSNEGRGFTRINLRMEKINDIQLLIPPLSEQDAISRYLDEKTTQLDSIIKVINSHIDKLKDFRKALIGDVVTGKIKVVSER